MSYRPNKLGGFGPLPTSLSRTIAVAGRGKGVASPCARGACLNASLSLDVLLYDRGRRMARGPQEVRRGPQAPPPAQFGELLPQNARRVAFDAAHDLTRREVRGHSAEQVNMVRHHFQSACLTAEFGDPFASQGVEPEPHITDQHGAAVLGTENDVIVDREDPAVVVGMFAWHILLDTRGARRLHLYSPDFNGGQPLLRPTKVGGFRGRGLL